MLSTLLPALLACAQSVNLDVGDNLILWPTPSDAYGAAAGQPGRWNAVITPYDVVLDGLAGQPTGVRVHSDVTQSFNWPLGNLTGDDSALMDDIQTIDPVTAQANWWFEGLQNGQYEVYTYAWAPENLASVFTSVDVVGSSGPVLVGGVWSGSPHVEGVTYARHTATVVDGTLAIVVGSTGGSAASVNGFQLTLLEGEVGTNYCTSTTNSSGGAAVMDGAGSSSIDQNDLVLLAAPVPDQPGLFFYGPSQVQVVFGNGFRCVGGQLFRLPIVVGAGGVMQHAVDYTNPPGTAGQITSGSTWNFQAWFRDPAGGGASFDLSDGYEIRFLP